MVKNRMLHRAPSRPAAAPPAFAARHRAFVARRLRRVVAPAVGALARTLRRMPSHVLERLNTVTRFHTRITERRWPPVTVGRTPAPRTKPPGRAIHRHERRTLLTRLVDRRTHAIDRTNTQVIERRIRTLSHVAGTESAGLRIATPVRFEARRTFPPVARTPVRITTAAAVPAARPDPLPPLAPASDGRDVARNGGSHRAPETVTLPQGELARVTEHVIAQLDRRVLSYRERMGLS